MYFMYTCILDTFMRLLQLYNRSCAWVYYNVPNFIYTYIICMRSSTRGLSASYIYIYKSYALYVIITIPVFTDFGDKRRR